MNKPIKDDIDAKQAGHTMTDPTADTVPMFGWNPKSAKTLEQWGWLDLGKPLPRDAVLSRVKPSSRDPEADFLIAGKVGMFLGEGGVGKTQTFVQLAIAVATGGEFIKGSGIVALEAGRVLLVCGEEDASELRRRFWYLLEELRLPAEVKKKAAQNITVFPLAGESCALQTVLEPGSRSSELAPTPRFEELKTLCKDGAFRLVLLDPASRFMGPDAEKDAKAATTFVELLEQLTNPDNEDNDGKSTGSRPAVLIAHHTNKASRDIATGKPTSNAARGSSALTDGVRWVAHLGPVGDDNDRLCLSVTKSNYTKHSWHDIKRESGGILRALTKAELDAEEQKRTNPKPAKNAALSIMPSIPSDI